MSNRNDNSQNVTIRQNVDGKQVACLHHKPEGETVLYLNEDVSPDVSNHGWIIQAMLVAWETKKLSEEQFSKTLSSLSSRG
jgi:hypothetical protein